MEGVLFIPPDRNFRTPETPCADCAQPFRPRVVADGVEELCDPCYASRFAPRPRRNGHKKPALAALSRPSVF